MSLILGPLLFVVIIFIPTAQIMMEVNLEKPISHLSPQIALGTMIWMVIWWVTECNHSICVYNRSLYFISSYIVATYWRLVIEDEEWRWRMKMDGGFFLLLTIPLASAGLRILLNSRFCDNSLRDSMHFVFLRKSFHIWCKGMRSFYLSSPPPTLLLYFSLMITMIYLMLYGY